jgi:hypothetical protein
MNLERHIFSSLIFASLLFQISSAFDSTASLIGNYSFYLKGTGTSGPYQLPHHFIISGSLKLTQPAGAELSPAEFELSVSNSILYLKAPLPVTDSLLVTYRYFNTELKKRYYHRELTTQSSAEAAVNPVPISNAVPLPTAPQTKEKSSSLQLKGNKSFSIEAGNSQNLQFKQGLDLSLQGQITEEVTVSAFLSDRGDFYSPSGSTQRLEELDKLRLEVSSPNFSGSLGDQQINFTQNKLTAFNKKIKGIQSKAKFSNISWETTVANSKGTFHTNQIQGEDGKQGPYYLSSPAGQTRVAVLSGTEKVWLDGQLLQRGSDLDYTIDYLTGSLFFTPHRLIASQSLIRVDFEYTQEDFSKKFVATRAQMSLQDGALKIGGSLISEGDVKDSPLGLSLSADQKQILTSAGDSHLKTQKSGATWVGLNLGDYLLVSDSSGNNYYQYVGEKQGDYQVQFSYVGEKAGGYIYQGAGIFTYQGNKQGNYAPLQSLPAPRSHRLLGLDLAFQPDSDWEVRLELAQSNLDQNTYSQLDDNDNRGWGFDSRVNFGKSDWSFLGQKIKQFRTSTGLFVRDENFTSFSRIEETESQKIWNLNSQVRTKRELKYDFSPQLSLGQNLNLSAYLGKLKRGTEFNSSRVNWNVTLPSLGSGIFSLSSDHTKSRLILSNDTLPGGNLEWKNRSFSWNQPVRVWVLKSAYTVEQRKQISFGQRWKKFEISLGTNASQLAYEAGWSKNQNHSFNSVWQPNSSTRTWRVRGSLREWKKVLTSNWEFTRNQIDYQVTGQKSNQNLALWQLDYSPLRGFLNLDLNYLLNQGRVDLKSFNYIQVPEGQGEYRLENGEYVPDPQGNYKLLIENNGNFRQTLSGEKSFHFTLEPGRLFSPARTNDGIKNLSSWFHSDTYLRLQSQVAGNSSLGFDFLLPWQTLESDTSYLENYIIQQELKITPSFTKHYLIVRWQKDRQANSQYLSATQLNQNFRRTLSAYLRFGPANLLELKQEHSLKEQVSSGFPSHRVKGDGLGLTYTRRLSNVSQYFCSSKYLSEEDKFQKIKSTLISLSPGLVYSSSMAARWRAKIAWTKVSSNARYINWLLAEGKKRGDNFDWDFGLDLKLKESFHYSASYRGTLLAGRSPLHFFRLDLTTTF